ncbi:kelch-like protein 10 [Pseudophryne corroboree]|uniref:kelch-like protein 10 n=1 Tax=Pseudophryne corroboree TaxID=495146 RepID=UPI003081CEB6
MKRKISPMAFSIFNELRLEGKLCDVVIKVNGHEFNAHKNILCGCSPYFRALFSSSWSNSEKKLYNIPGISPDMMRLIIEYAYTRSMTITTNNVEELLIAADQLNIMGIVQACSEFMIGQLCLENCIGICKFTEYYYCPDLRQKAYLYILHNFEDIVKTSHEFLELSAMELRDFIEKDELNIKQEDVLFEAIIKWIDHDTTARKQFISILLSEVRLALMNPEYFMNSIKTHDYVKNSEECKTIIIKALTDMYDLNMHGVINYDCTKPLTRPRLPNAILLAIGGWSSGFPTNAIESYDARADRWVNVTCHAETPRAYHGTAYLKGYVYIIGGFNSMDYFNSVKRFDPFKKIWQEVAPMHSKRCYISVTVLDNHIYAMGGYDGHVRLNTAERYEPENNQWTMIAPMHEQRSDASATTLDGKVYICGGFNGMECLFTAEVYSPEIGQWNIIAPMESPRSGLGAIAYRDQIYVVGGFDGVNRLRSVEAYSPTSNTWHIVPSMFHQRSNFGIGVVDDRLFVAGGFNDFTTSYVECYDEKSGEWYDVQDMNFYRSALSCCVVPGLTNVRGYTVR